jgi:hypothetical protein
MDVQQSDLCAEMMKAGLIEEMMDDVMDGVNETEEDEVDVEVQKVLQEVAGEEIAELPDAGRTKVEPEKTEEVRTPGTLRPSARQSAAPVLVQACIGERPALRLLCRTCSRSNKNWRCYKHLQQAKCQRLPKQHREDDTRLVDTVCLRLLLAPKESVVLLRKYHSSTVQCLQSQHSLKRKPQNRMDAPLL